MWQRSRALITHEEFSDTPGDKKGFNHTQEKRRAWIKVYHKNKPGSLEREYLRVIHCTISYLSHCALFSEGNQNSSDW